MAVNERDFSLLKDEVDCLRKKFTTTLSTAGGSVGPITSPGSSVVPNDAIEDCACVDIETQISNVDDNCPSETGESDTNLGDFAEVVEGGTTGAAFVFDAISGVFYLPPSASSYENRNTGLSDVTLEHGGIDPWWYRKKNSNVDNAILWRVGDGKVLRSTNAGRSSWNTKTPIQTTDLPDYREATTKFMQVIVDPFNQDVIYLLARPLNANKCWLFRSVNDGRDWQAYDLTDYNDATERYPVWLNVSVGGAFLWITSWNGVNLTLLKLNNDTTISVNTEIIIGSATLWQVQNQYEVAYIETALDDDLLWLYGRMLNPMELGLAHIIQYNGTDWTVIENTWGNDWCGSFKASVADESDNRIFYSVRNTR